MTRSQIVNSASPRQVLKVLDRALTHEERIAAAQKQIAEKRAAKKAAAANRRPWEVSKVSSGAGATMQPAAQPKVAPQTELEIYEFLLKTEPRVAGDYYKRNAEEIILQQGLRNTVANREINEQLEAQRKRGYHLKDQKR